MKKIMVFLTFFLFIASTSQAFLYEIKLLSKSEIKALTDEELTATLIEAKVEEKASQEFHQGAGFSSAKEYYKRKDLLRFIIYLRQEMKTREMKADPLDSWLK